MTATEVTEASFLRRSEAEWRRVGYRLSIEPRGALPAWAGVLLARAGELTCDELARLRRIAGRVERHDEIDAAHAAVILAAQRRHGAAADL